MRRLFVVLLAAWLLSPAGCSGADQTTKYHLETASARADLRLYMLNDTVANYLSEDNDSEQKDVRLGSGYVISTSIDFELVHNGHNLSEDLNLTSGGNAGFTIWLKGSREARGLRLGAEVGAGNGSRSCGRADVLVNLGTVSEPFDVVVPLNSSQLKMEENLRATVYIDYIGLPIGMPLVLDIVTGANMTSVVLPVENFARLVMDLAVDGGKSRVEFRAEGEGPFWESIMMKKPGFIISGPTTPKSIFIATVPSILVAYWEYGRDGARGGRYTFEASYMMPSGKIIEGNIAFELPAPDSGLGGGTMWFLLAVVVTVIALTACIVVLRRRRRKG